MAQGLAITRAQLAKMRRTAADNVQGEHHAEQLAELTRIHLAIAAIDAVLAERGQKPPPSPWEDPNFSLSKMGR